MWDAWRQTHCIADATIRVLVEARDAALLRLTSVAARPQLVGTDIHWAQGWFELGAQAWDDHSGTLSLRVPATARLYHGPGSGAWVLCARAAAAARRRAIAGTGARLFPIPSRRGHLDLCFAMTEMARAGLSQILVEGGGELAAALLRQGLVDEIHWFVSPRLIGGDGRPALGSLGLPRLADAPELCDVRVRRLGEDVHIHGRVRGVRAPRAPAERSR